MSNLVQLGILVALLSLPLARSTGQEPGSAEGEHLLLGRAVPSRDPLFQGLQLAVFSGELRGEDLSLRIGFLNAGARPIAGRLVYDESDFNLLGTDYLGRNPPGEMAEGLKVPIPEGGLLQGSPALGTMQFRVPENGGTVSLQVTGFPDLELDLAKADRFVPPDLSGLGVTSVLGLELESEEGALAVIPWTIYSMSSNGRETTFRVGFTNGARAAINWASRLTGQSARLLDSEGRAVEPSEVSASLDQGIGRVGKPWPAGFENTGTITFPTPARHAARSLRLILPGFPQIQLDYDVRSESYRATRRAAPAGRKPGNLPASVASEKAFRELKQLVGELGAGLRSGDTSRHLGCFREGRLRDRHTYLLQGTRRAPIASATYELPARQPFRVEPDGTVRDVILRFRYTIAGISAENEFVTLLKASFARVKTPLGWEITHLATIARPPFWELGYTGVRETEHFVVLYPPATESAENVDRTAAQVEKSYRTLRGLGFDLEKRYAAFFIPSEDHFQALTTKDARRFSGVASAAYEIREGDFVATNRAMYINDFRFLVMQRVWGLQDRQKTITHELVHLALAHETRPFTPGWLVEGAAVFHAKQIDSFTRGAVRDAPISRRFTHAQMSAGPILGAGIADERVVSLMYAYSGETYSWLVRRFGRERVLAFYRDFARPTPSDLKRFVREEVVTGAGEIPGLDKLALQLTERLVQAHFGMGLSDLTGEIRAHLKLR